jgi:hypothetical protein
MFNLERDWPVLVLLGVVVWFVTYVIIKGRRQERAHKETENKKKG